jgi:hypothetical protein
MSALKEERATEDTFITRRRVVVAREDTEEEKGDNSNNSLCTTFIIRTTKTQPPFHFLFIFLHIFAKNEKLICEMKKTIGVG